MEPKHETLVEASREVKETYVSVRDSAAREMAMVLSEPFLEHLHEVRHGLVVKLLAKLLLLVLVLFPVRFGQLGQKVRQLVSVP